MLDVSTEQQGVKCLGLNLWTVVEELMFRIIFPGTFTWPLGFTVIDHKFTLQGVKYNISFTKQSNETNGCLDYSIIPGSGICRRFYKETSLPNLIGDEYLEKFTQYFKHSGVMADN